MMCKKRLHMDLRHTQNMKSYFMFNIPSLQDSPILFKKVQLHPTYIIHLQQLMAKIKHKHHTALSIFVSIIAFL